MSNRIPTVVVKGQHGQPLIINEKDFDKKHHELFEEKKEEKPKKKELKKKKLIKK